MDTNEFRELLLYKPSTLKEKWWGFKYWLDNHGVRAQVRNYREVRQRKARGFSDRDLWGLDQFLAKLIVDSVSDFRFGLLDYCTIEGRERDLTLGLIVQGYRNSQSIWESYRGSNVDNDSVKLAQDLLQLHIVRLRSDRLIHQAESLGRVGTKKNRLGYSPADLGELGKYLAGVIGRSVAAMREEAHGHPGELTFEEWLNILDKISKAYLAVSRGEMPEDYLQASDLFNKWFFGLWT